MSCRWLIPSRQTWHTFEQPSHTDRTAVPADKFLMVTPLWWWIRNIQPLCQDEPKHLQLLQQQIPTRDRRQKVAQVRQWMSHAIGEKKVMKLNNLHLNILMGINTNSSWCVGHPWWHWCEYKSPGPFYFHTHATLGVSTHHSPLVFIPKTEKKSNKCWGAKLWHRHREPLKRAGVGQSCNIGGKGEKEDKRGELSADSGRSTFSKELVTAWHCLKMWASLWEALLPTKSSWVTFNHGDFECSFRKTNVNVAEVKSNSSMNDLSHK